MTTSGPVTLEKKIASFPPLPITVSRVLEVTSDPESSANDLMKAILPDQAMCVAILKIANSVIYGRPKKVASLENAIVVLGFNEVRDIVLCKAAVKTFKNLLSGYKQEINAFWDHAFTCGLSARVISDHLNVPSGQFFVTGLLHDIGKLAMLIALGDAYDPGKWFYNFSTNERLDEERSLFKVSHDLIGSRLLERWNFPESVVASLKYHHAPEKAGKLSKYALVIQLADFLAAMCLIEPRLSEAQLKENLELQLPGFIEAWKAQGLPWNEISLESWFNWLRVDRSHGSSILDILSF